MLREVQAPTHLLPPAPVEPAFLPAALGAVVHSPRMQHIVRVLEQLSGTSLPVLILGETGSGKEVVAEWAQRLSWLRDRPWIKTNCAGLTDSVVESELFGHERGAFTGAHSTHRGLFEAADGGTLFLDELGELPLRTQAKLLRVIETGEFCRLGSTQTRRVKVRFLAATHRDLRARMERGDFRSDLYFRLSGVCIAVPPLRERREEIVPLAQLFLRRSAASAGRLSPELAPEARQALLQHDWPGNVRELRNVMECAAALCSGAVIGAGDLALAGSLPARVEGERDSALPGGSASPLEVCEPPDGRILLKDELLDFERARICQAIAQSNGNQTQAARLLGICRRTLTNKLNRLGVARPRKVVAGAR